MSVAYNVATGTTATTTPSTASLNHAAKVLVVINISYVGTTSPNAVTVGGVAATYLAGSKSSSGTNNSNEMWYLYVAGAANDTISVGFASATRVAWNAVSYTGTAKVTPFFQGLTINNGSGSSVQTSTVTAPAGQTGRMLICAAGGAQTANATGSIAIASTGNGTARDSDRELAGSSSTQAVGSRIKEYADSGAGGALTYTLTKSSSTIGWVTFVVGILAFNSPTKTVTMTALLRYQGDTSHTVNLDTLLRLKGNTSTVNLDTVIKLIGLPTVNLDAMLKGLGVASTAALDILLKSLNASATVNVDSLIQFLADKKTVNADTLLKYLGDTKTVNLDGLLQGLGVTNTVLFDSLFRSLGVTQTVTLDALLKVLGVTKTISVDALIEYLGDSQTVSLDTLFKVLSETKQLTVDALLKSSDASQVLLDSMLRDTSTSSVLLDAIIILIIIEGIVLISDSTIYSCDVANGSIFGCTATDVISNKICELVDSTSRHCILQDATLVFCLVSDSTL